MNRRTAYRISIVFLLTYLFLVMAFSQIGSFYTKPLLPLFEWEIQLLLPGVKVDSIHLDDYYGQKVILVKGDITKRIEDADRILTIGGPFTTKVPVMNQYLHPIIMFSILAAWPGISRKDRFKVFCMALPVILVVELVDIPLVVVNQCQGGLKSLMIDAPTSISVASYWISFLNIGGRYLLSILGACLTMGSFYLLQVSRIKAPSRNDPCVCGSGKKYKHCCMGKR